MAAQRKCGKFRTAPRRRRVRLPSPLVRRGWLGPAAVALVVATAGCTVAVPGHGAAAPPPGAAVATSPPGGPPVPTEPPRPAGPRSGLDVDALPDECLLNAAEFGDLVGVVVRPPAQGSVQRDDGSRSSSCVATTGTEPIAMINVYGTRSGTPAEYVRSGPAGRRDLSGVGEAATVIDTATGPTLQLASPRYLVTILVTGRVPSDDAWRTAAAAALSRLPP
jgi:hypothetical protein